MKEQHLIYRHTINTPIGKMEACATSNGICLLEFEERNDLDKQRLSLLRYLPGKIIPGSNAHILKLHLQMDQYFEKEREVFDIPLVYAGTPFQITVWDELRKIPFGATTTYAAVTRKLGNMKAIRAVAGANGANKLAILIPCHRVMGTDGSLVGYAGGMWRKKWLLEHESRQRKMSF